MESILSYSLLMRTYRKHTCHFLSFEWIAHSPLPVTFRHSDGQMASALRQSSLKLKRLGHSTRINELILWNRLNRGDHNCHFSSFFTHQNHKLSLPVIGIVFNILKDSPVENQNRRINSVVHFLNLHPNSSCHYLSFTLVGNIPLSLPVIRSNQPILRHFEEKKDLNYCHSLSWSPAINLDQMSLSVITRQFCG